MLVIDDFNELVGLEGLFRRLGFDVLSLGRESSVPEALLGFPADLTMATGQGRYVDGLKLSSKLRQANSRSKLVVLIPSVKLKDENFSALSYADVDAVIETPFDPRSALKVVAHLLSLDVDPLLERYEKILSARLFEPNELKILKSPLEPVRSPQFVSKETSAGIALQPPPVFTAPMTAREARYAKFLDDKAEEDLPPIASMDILRSAQKRLTDEESNASIDKVQEAARLLREKREFVRAMIEAGQDDGDDDSNDGNAT